jgi:hypothetical protein
VDTTTQETLRQAYHLIKAGDTDAARELLKPVLAAERDNVDAWWLAAHAAAHPADTRLALLQVLRLKPDHGPAQVMLDQLNRDHPEVIDQLVDEVAPLPPPGTRQRDQALVSNRWVWNVVMAVGCLGLMFGSLALIASFAGITWFEDKVEDLGETLGVDVPERGERGQFGTVYGGDPANPVPIPVTVKKGATVSTSSPMVETLKKDEAHIYTFSGQAGEDVMALLQFTIAGDAHYVMELWDANERKLADGVGAANSGTVTLVYTLRRSGQYALVIIGRPDGPRGDYALGLEVN